MTVTIETLISAMDSRVGLKNTAIKSMTSVDLKREVIQKHEKEVRVIKSVKVW